MKKITIGLFFSCALIISFYGFFWLVFHKVWYGEWWYLPTCIVEVVLFTFIIGGLIALFNIDS